MDEARAAAAPARRSTGIVFPDGLRLGRLFADSAQIAGEFTPYPATAEELLATLDGTRRLLANELALKAQRERLDQAYGIAPAVIAPRDKTAVLRTALAQCARRIEQHGLAEEAARLRADPAATLGRGTPPETTAGDAIDEALARATEFRTARRPCRRRPPTGAICDVPARTSVRRPVCCARRSTTTPPSPAAVAGCTEPQGLSRACKVRGCFSDHRTPWWTTRSKS